jgi:hypothetical protein
MPRALEMRCERREITLYDRVVNEVSKIIKEIMNILHTNKQKGD